MDIWFNTCLLSCWVMPWYLWQLASFQTYTWELMWITHYVKQFFTQTVHRCFHVIQYNELLFASNVEQMCANRIGPYLMCTHNMDTMFTVFCRQTVPGSCLKHLSWPICVWQESKTEKGDYTPMNICGQQWSTWWSKNKPNITLIPKTFAMHSCPILTMLTSAERY